MEDPNSIAWLLPAMSESEDKTGRTWEAIRMNIPEYIPLQGDVASDLRSRESTVPLEDAGENTSDESSYPRLYLTFSRGLKVGRGLVFGTDSNCDIVLPKLSKISRSHCALTFDDERRLILRDFSTNGTIVKYNDKGGELRRHFVWILGGHRVPRDTKRVVIVVQGISFRISVSTHDSHIDLYNANVDRFLEEAIANDELPLGALGIQSTRSTAAPSGTHTPSQGPIRLKQETLGKGAFAVVRRFWDVSTGLEYAYKEPRDKYKFDWKAWEKEADIMGRISHENIVKLVESILKPSPRLVLEYLPLGNLEYQHLHRPISDNETLAILQQSLSALSYLHGHKPQIVHRDIKPENILVQSRDPLHIKFADFGLAKATSSLKTICGTGTYVAPEIARYCGLSKSIPRDKYTEQVDIWSLGVVILKYGYGLPHPGGGIGLLWCQKIIQRAKDCDSDDVIDLLTTGMLIKASSRYSAKICLDIVLEFSVPFQSGSLTPTPASYAEGYEATVTGSLNGENPQYEDSITSSVIQRYVRSTAPPPDSDAPVSAERQKRSTRPSSSSSSSGGRRAKRHGRAAAASPSSRQQRRESEPVIDLFGEGWLQDPNCVGSSVAAMGKDLSEWSSWGSQPTEPSEEYVPGVEHDYDYNPNQIQGRDFAQEYPVNTVVDDGGDGTWTDSEGYMAARVLQAIRGECL